MEIGETVRVDVIHRVQYKLVPPEIKRKPE